jgi:hypothetical protein
LVHTAIYEWLCATSTGEYGSVSHESSTYSSKWHNVVTVKEFKNKWNYFNIFGDIDFNFIS